MLHVAGLDFEAGNPCSDVGMSSAVRVRWSELRDALCADKAVLLAARVAEDQPAAFGRTTAGNLSGARVERSASRRKCGRRSTSGPERLGMALAIKAEYLYTFGHHIHLYTSGI